MAIKKKKDKKKKLPTVQKLKKDLDILFSLYIRKRDKGRCFTCGKTDDIKRMQCGHYISRSCNELRYDEKNCNCQCSGCNIFKYGDAPTYTMNLITKYGVSLLQEFDSRKRINKQFSIKELQDLIVLYKEKFKKLSYK